MVQHIAEMPRAAVTGQGSNKRRAPWRACGRLLERLQDPHDTLAALWVAAAVMLFEAALCPLLIAKVPCEQRCWLPHVCMPSAAART